MHEDLSPRSTRSTVTVTDSVRSLVDDTLAAWEPVFGAMDQTWRSLSRGWDPGGDRAYRRRDRRPASCGCEDCAGREPCRDRCTCCGCASDADVLLVARPGELRVIPIEIRNPRHRELTVSLDAGPWTSCAGATVPVKTVVRPQGELIVPGCSTREVLLVVEIAAQGEKRDQEPAEVTCCTTLTSHVRVDGCGTVLKVAIDLLPSVCAAVEVTCCGCG